MPRKAPLLKLVFESAEAFRKEYADNLVNGGVFVPTSTDYELRDSVEIEMSLAGSAIGVRMTGEVVHIVPRSMSDVGGVPGVAVQFSGASHEIRARLEPLAGATGTLQYRPSDSGRRAAPRTRANVVVRVTDIENGAVIRGRTRNLSRGGALVAVHDDACIPVGRHVRLRLEHPTSGDRLDVAGTVVRHVDGDDGQAIAMGVQFSAPRDAQPRVEAFLDDLQSVEHARLLGGIGGTIEEVGIDGLIQMFGNNAQAGTLTLRDGANDATIVLDGGLVRHARAGSATGIKAIMRVLTWTEGSFEFHAHVDPEIAFEAPLPVEAALLEAARLLDEVRQVDRSRFPATARVCAGDESQAGDVDGLTKIEAAVMDLARTGSFTVQRAVDLIPEPDTDVYAALESLMDCGAVRLDP